jgi:hypothetical protein
MMELCCHLFGFKVTKANIGRVQNDPKGYFDLARNSFLNDHSKFLRLLLALDIDKLSRVAVKKVNFILITPGFTMERVRNTSEALEIVYGYAKALILS